MTTFNPPPPGQQSSPKQQRSKPKAAGIAHSAGRFARIAVIVLTLPIRVFVFLTQAPGSAIPFGFMATYLLLVNIEGYWQSLGMFSNALGMMTSDRPAFIPKPFIADGADLRNLGIAMQQGTFWLAAVISVLVQTIQAISLREDVKHLKAAYEKDAKHTVPDAKPNVIDRAEYRRKKIKTAGMKQVKQKGALVYGSYGADIAIALSNYPIWSLLNPGMILVHLVWAFLSVLGSENAIAMFMDAIDGVFDSEEK